MRAWPVSILLAPMLLAGCGTPAPEPTATPSPDPIVNVGANVADTAQPNDTLLVGQAELNQAIPAVQRNASDVEATIRYACDKGLVVMVRHDLAWDMMHLTIGSTSYALGNTLSTTGARYRADPGRMPGKSLVWASKGDQAMLVDVPPGADADSADDTGIKCHKTD
ncbi:MAG: hypothetical protein JWN66_1748 [Sphingomonas bacterium]|uniref:MliC family protein n=1 Tax=Sphingomonas bacterium TaxID=1895847 RepID=UPI0026219474|nr:MliC family protein [Sphingomonas bacterium]MDB5704632.1 hypothetical protein [Sphingomonas bacterium]